MSTRNVQWVGPVLLAIGLFLCLPFWSSGPGAEEDAWGHILTLEQWKTTSDYIPSRPPGHPVYEYLTYPLHAVGGWYAVVILSSIMIGLAAWALFILMGKTGRAFYGSLLFLVSYPALYAGITALDYATALALLLWSFVAWERKKTSLSGLLMGVSAGARLTMVLGGLRFLIKPDYRLLGKAVLAGVAGLALAYFWPLFSFGPALIQTYALPYPDLPTLAYRVIFTGLTPLGLMAFLVLLPTALRLKSPYLPVILAFLGLFLAYPHKGIFLLPVWALVIAQGWPRLTHRMAILVFVLVFLSPHAIGVQLDTSMEEKGAQIHVRGRRVNLSWPGSLWQELAKRTIAAQTVEHALGVLPTLSSGCMVIAGPHFAPIRYRALQQGMTLEAKVVYYCNPDRLDSLAQVGGTLYHFPGQDELNNRVYPGTQTNSMPLPGMNP